MTIDPDKTQQYAGINLLAELENHLLIGIGGAFGPTPDSEDGILRLVAVQVIERSQVVVESSSSLSK